MSDAAETVKLEVREDIAYITLDAPPLNILTGAMMDLLGERLAQAESNRAVKAIALSANGKAFSAGADIGEHEPERAGDMIASFSRLFGRLGALELPLVISVDGAALGGGFELAIMADVLIASDRATFGQPEIRLGFFAPVGVAWLSALVGPARAIEITSTGRSYSAAEMHAMGLCARVVPAEELAAAGAAVLADLRRASAHVMRMNVRMVRRLRGRPFEAARREAEAVFLDELMATEDVREGLAAFREKRRPSWKNR